MGRGKLPLRLIEKERARRITCAKRKKGLVKKAYELSTLCDIKVCVVIHDSDAVDGNCLRTYPEHPSDVAQIAADYFAAKAKNPSKRHLTLADFYAARIRRLRSDADKLSRAAAAAGTPPDSGWDSRIDGFTREQLLDLVARLDRKIDEVAELKARRAAAGKEIDVGDGDGDVASTAMVVGGSSSSSQGQLGQAWFQHQQPPGSSDANAFVDQTTSFDLSPWSGMNNLPYYTRLLEAPDLCSLGISLDSDNYNNDNYNYNNNHYYHHGEMAGALQPYQNAPLSILYGGTSSSGGGPVQYYPGPAGELYHGAAAASAVYQYAGGGPLEDVKFYAGDAANHLGFGKSSNGV